ncbi:glycosyltransferase family 4 protein [Sphingobacterium ginsenosidimutans]|uniref:Glycosyltransferase family 4 protein n=2 Tax=Sphingobacterium ginsenosidimutans TaxID=687845 RepID=A0ABP7ZQN4_9SPHI
MERVLTNKANYLVAQGYDITIVTTDQQGRKPYFDLDDRIHQIDLGINYTNDQNKGVFAKLWNYRWRQVKHKSKLKQLLLQLKSDVVISMFDHDTSFVHKMNDGSFKILEIHFSRYKRLQYGRRGVWKLVDILRNREDLNIARKYDRFVVLTEEDRMYWGKLPNIAVIPNANSFSVTDQALLVNKNAIAVGRLDYQKGFDNLIKIWKIIQLQHPEWTLHIYGNGPLKRRLEDLIKILGLTGCVQIHSATPDIKTAYLASSIYLMASRYEGLPMALLEAQSCGLPMVSYACKCGPRDIIIEEKNGFLIAEGEMEDFASKINLLIENDVLRKVMGENARTMSARFSENQVMQLWLNLFKNLV